MCGSKNVGKSGFAKLLANNLLNRASQVGFMDTDLGQPEFTPPGGPHCQTDPQSLRHGNLLLTDDYILLPVVAT